MFSLAVLACSVISATVAQFVPAPTDLIGKAGYAGVNIRYKEVPTGICELDPTVKSYSGYADVEENQHIFFWFFGTSSQCPYSCTRRLSHRQQKRAMSTQKTLRYLYGSMEDPARRP